MELPTEPQRRTQNKTVKGKVVWQSPMDAFKTPQEGDLDLEYLVNGSSLSISILPNGAVFTIEHGPDRQRTMINQVLASSLAGGIGRLYVRVGEPTSKILRVTGPGVDRCGGGDDRFVWESVAAGLRHEVILWLHPDLNLWLWQIEVSNMGAVSASCDAILLQDLGVADRGFVMGSEAYTSQYLDHHIAHHHRAGPVVMTRQNLSQHERHPWVAHGCLDGAIGFATDLRQVMGPAFRDAPDIACPFGTDLPSSRLQHEAACAALQSAAVRLKPGDSASWTFFGFYSPDHPAASDDSDLTIVERVERGRQLFSPRTVPLAPPSRSLLQDAPPLIADPFDDAFLAERWPRRVHQEHIDDKLVSFFAESGSTKRHIVLRDKERIIIRRHGVLLRSGSDLLPSETTVCTTCWMHGVFAAQLTIGNVAFHKLFSVSRDPYNIVRASGLRMLVEESYGWRLLAVPSAFDMGLSDCRWIYRSNGRTIEVTAVVAGEEPAIQWRVTVAGAPCRFIVFGHLVVGERELANAARIEIDPSRKEFIFYPDLSGLWGQHYPHASLRLVTSTPASIEAVGGSELINCDGARHGDAFAALRTFATNEFAIAVVGSMSEPQTAELLAAKYSRRVEDVEMLEPSNRFWLTVTRGARLRSPRHAADAEAMDTIFPWFVHDAMVHLTVPHGLEQYSGGAWGTRDICQGPVELLLSLEHDEPVKSILRILFAQQYENRGDWPQWFMLEPYSVIQDRNPHGDVVIWPLKALCDYIEATGDFAFMDERVVWRRDEDLEKTDHDDSIADHVDKLLTTIRERFIPDTHLVRYGHGDWNDSLQPVDPKLRDWMTSSWTVALLYQQLRRYAEILRRAGQPKEAQEHETLAIAIREDFNCFLVREGTVAGYAVFGPSDRLPELLLHPSDKRTGISYSLIPITQAIMGGLFTPGQVNHHLKVIREHLTFTDGIRLMDKPIVYRGGPEMIFHRAESSAFFGREIGLMYVHSHLRFAQAMAILRDAEALWHGLAVINPIAVTERLAHASLRQRNAYFSSSDAAFEDRYQASIEWNRVKAGTIAVDGGWRIYSSGPGLLIGLLVQYAMGFRRHFGKRMIDPCLPDSQTGLSLEWTR